MKWETAITPLRGEYYRVYPNFLLEKVDLSQLLRLMRAYQHSFRQQVRIRILPKKEARQARQMAG
jgi:hypothetical protein